MRPEIILGPPGTGKTTTLLGIVEQELAAGTPPDKIGYLSFTRAAAEEAVSRACQRFDLKRTQFPYFRTLHSLCFHQLGMGRGDVLEGRLLQNDFADYAGVKITGRWSEDGTLSGFDTGDRILFMENLARVRGVDLRDQHRLDSDGLNWSMVERVAAALSTFKRERGLLDYTDMLQEFIRSGITVPLDVLVVDEAQDLSHLQWMVVEQLRRGARRYCVAGDDDQAIYIWSGADPDHLISLDGDARVLGRSFRVPPAVQQVAMDLVPAMGRRREKEWEARQDTQGSVLYHRDLEKVDFTEGEVLVLARNTYILREQVEPLLREQGIFYHRMGHSSVSRGVLDAIHYWEDLRAGRSVPVQHVRQVYQHMSSGKGVARGHKELPAFREEEAERGEVSVNLDDLEERGGLMTRAIWHEALDRLPNSDAQYILRARRRGERLETGAPRVRLSTIHGAKGGECDRVVVMKEIARRTYHEMRFAREAEARVWYVAVTRAREQLEVVQSTTPQACPWI